MKTKQPELNKITALYERLSRDDEQSGDTKQGRGEALYGAVTEDEEHDTGDDGRQVTVDDGRVGFRETVFDGQREPLAAAQLLLDTFVDDDVGIDGHTHRQDDTRDTRQRQHGAERHQDAHQQEDVGQQGDVSHLLYYNKHFPSLRFSHLQHHSSSYLQSLKKYVARTV